MAKRKVYEPVEGQDYKRYAVTADGVSPMAIPGQTGGQYTADGLTHTVRGTPSSKWSDQKEQMDKRAAKIEQFDFGQHWGLVEGAGNTVILTWGSLTGPAREAIGELVAEGTDVRLVSLRQISPFPVQALQHALTGAARVLVLEQTHAGQFYRHIRSHMDLPGEVRQFNREGPYLIGPDEIATQIHDWKT
jgi:2-oxoglutarate ferredoxin oxidoreductase subunit alpha